MPGPTIALARVAAATGGSDIAQHVCPTARQRLDVIKLSRRGSAHPAPVVPVPHFVVKLVSREGHASRLLQRSARLGMQQLTRSTCRGSSIGAVVCAPSLTVYRVVRSECLRLAFLVGLRPRFASLPYRFSIEPVIRLVVAAHTGATPRPRPTAISSVLTRRFAAPTVGAYSHAVTICQEAG